MAIAPSQPALTLPDHTQLPETDGTFVKNFQEHPQSLLLTDSIGPVLDRLHPDGRYAIGQDCGIYWRLTEPPERGAEAPDWFYVPNVPPLLDGKMRRSYVLWKEIVAPLIVIEFVSGDGSEERDTTSPLGGDETRAGKFWVYERAIRVPFYAIYTVEAAAVEVYELMGDRYQLCAPNQRGRDPTTVTREGFGSGTAPARCPIQPPWEGWGRDGHLLLQGDERAEQERQRTEQERQRAEQERQRADRLANRLRELGIDPDTINSGGSPPVKPPMA